MGLLLHILELSLAFAGVFNLYKLNNNLFIIISDII